MGLFTGKLGRYNGRGDSIYDAIVGEHNAAHYFAPFLPMAAIMSGKWVGNVYSTDASRDFTETKENSGTIAMSQDGLLFTTGAADGNSCNTQMIRAYPVTANKNAIFFCRLKCGDNANAGWVFGAHITDSDYWSTEPTQQAVFFKDKGAASNVVVGRTKDGTTGSNSASLFNAADDTYRDLCVVVKGTSGVQFFHKLSTTDTWTKSAMKSTNLPLAGQYLRLTANIENNTSGSGETMTIPYLGAYWQL